MSNTITIARFDPHVHFTQAESFATQGMHLDAYTNNALQSKLYGRYCLCEAIIRSTHFYGAYEGDKFVGFLMADMHGQPKPYEHSRYAWQYRSISTSMRLAGAKKADDVYKQINQQMLSGLSPAPDAEMVFFAADPTAVGKGIGSQLLSALEQDFAGKRVFLYTDDGCTYQFYEHRGFTREDQKTLSEKSPGGLLTMECMIYVKQM